MIDFLKEGDLVLADKGFTIEDLCAVKNATLLIPPFLSTGKKFTKEQTVVTKLIAKSRIHVERFNERFKKMATVVWNCSKCFHCMLSSQLSRTTSQIKSY
jgi:hypothetical protein